MKTITIAAYNRPENTRWLVDSLLSQVGSEGWQILARVDKGGHRFDDVLAELGRLGDCYDYAVRWPSENVGINANTYCGMLWAFEELGADWNLYLEDDLELSPDALALCDWFIENRAEISKDFTDVAALCLFNLHGDGDPQRVTASRRFTGWGFLMHRSGWERYARPAWFACRPAMWDNCVAKRIRMSGNGIVNAFPDLSRVLNTGQNGAHLTPDKWGRRMDGFEWQRDSRSFLYKFESDK